MASKSPRGLRIFQIVLWGLVLVAVGYMVILPRLIPTSNAVAVSGTVTSLGPDVAMNKPFALVDEAGATVTEANFAGKPGAWFYGFTNCPDICPTALAEMGALLAQLGDDAGKINAVFVTVDPERDTPQVLGEFMAFFDERLTGLTGTLDQITTFAKDRMVAFEKLPQGDSYAMQHPAGIYLVDASGLFAGTLDPEESMDVKLGKLRKLIGT